MGALVQWQEADGDAQAAVKRMRASFQLPFAAAPSAQTGEASQSAADDNGTAAAVLGDKASAAGGTTGADIRAFIDAQSPAAVEGGPDGRAADATPQQPNGGMLCGGHALLCTLGASAWLAIRDGSSTWPQNTRESQLITGEEQISSHECPTYVLGFFNAGFTSSRVMQWEPIPADVP